MSPTAARRLRRGERHVCLECRSQRSLFRYRGQVRADRDHTLCLRCYRAQVNRVRAMRLGGMPTPPPLKVDLAWSVGRARGSDIFARALGRQ